MRHTIIQNIINIKKKNICWNWQWNSAASSFLMFLSVCSARQCWRFMVFSFWLQRCYFALTCGTVAVLWWLPCTNLNNEFCYFCSLSPPSLPLSPPFSFFILLPFAVSPSHCYRLYVSLPCGICPPVIEMQGKYQSTCPSLLLCHITSFFTHIPTHPKSTIHHITE